MPWTKLTDAPAGSEYSSLCWMQATGLLWVYDDNGTLSSYDPATDTWVSTYTQPAQNVGGNSQLFAMSNGRLALVRSYGSPLVQMYDPATDSWTTGTLYPSFAGYCQWASDGVLIYGALADHGASIYNGHSSMTYCAIYDPSTDQWDVNTLPSLPVFSDTTSGLGYGSLHYIPATANSNATLVYVNGWWNQRAPLGETYTLDLTVLDGWNPGSPMDIGREDQAPGTSGVTNEFEYAVVVGGDSDSDNNMVSVEVYDALNDIWTAVDDLPVGLDNPGATIGGGYVWVYGGWTRDPNAPSVGDQTAILRMPYSAFPHNGRLPQPAPPQPATTQLQLNTPVLDTPGYLNVSVTNVPAGELISFRRDHDDPDHEIDTATADDNGNLLFHDVLVSIQLLDGSTHTLYANNATTGSDSADFTVTNNQPQEEDVSQPVAPVLIPRVGVQRWYFQDPTGNNPGHYIFPRNPEKYSTPFADKVLTYDFSSDHANGQPITYEGKPKPVEWTFEGKLFTKAEEAQFVYWFTRPYRIYVVDHENRAYTVYLKGLDIEPAQTLQHMEKRTYKITATLYGPPVQLA